MLSLTAIDLAAARAATSPLSDADARCMLARLGLPVDALMAVRARLYACAAKHGVHPAASRPDRDAHDHLAAVDRHLAAIVLAGGDLLATDRDDPGSHLTAAMCRGLLALDEVATSGRSITVGGGKLRYEGSGDQAVIAGLMGRIGRLPELEAALRSIARGEGDAVAVARAALEGA